jgi:hypothetical protein
MVMHSPVTMETAADCYRHAVRCDHLAKFALSDADRDATLAAAVNWRKLAGSAEEAETTAKLEYYLDDQDRSQS